MSFTVKRGSNILKVWYNIALNRFLKLPKCHTKHCYMVVHSSLCELWRNDFKMLPCKLFPHYRPCNFDMLFLLAWISSWREVIKRHMRILSIVAIWEFMTWLGTGSHLTGLLSPMINDINVSKQAQDSHFIVTCWGLLPANLTDVSQRYSTGTWNCPHTPKRILKHMA